MGFFDFFKTRPLDAALKATTRVKVHGIFFEIRKLNPLDFASGAKALHMQFETYKTKPEQEQIALMALNKEKIKEHYTDVICSAVVSPVISRKPDIPGTTYVEHLFTDWELASDLYLKIMEVTHGKKKLRSHLSRATASSI